MERLLKGIHEFQELYFRKEEEFFQRLSTGQSPEVLFITCSDSRIDPNLITRSRPGDLFIVRNVGNIIPPYDTIGEKSGVAAAIEFAVQGLRVKDIIVCGHSNCGAMEALFKDEKDLKDMPLLKGWLSLSVPVRDAVMKHYGNASRETRQRAAEEENVLFQLHNIHTYPFVNRALDEGCLHLHGWYYNIGTGSIYSYSPSEDVFALVGEPGTRDDR